MVSFSSRQGTPVVMIRHPFRPGHGLEACQGAVCDVGETASPIDRESSNLAGLTAERKSMQRQRHAPERFHLEQSSEPQIMQIMQISNAIHLRKLRFSLSSSKIAC